MNTKIVKKENTDSKIMSLDELRGTLKTVDKSAGQEHRIRIPDPDKEMAKTAGAKWNKNGNYWAYKSDKGDEHPLYVYRTENESWQKLKVQPPYAVRESFKAHGVVTEKEGDEWCAYVLAIDKYTPLLELLIDGEML